MADLYIRIFEDSQSIANKTINPFLRWVCMAELIEIWTRSTPSRSAMLLGCIIKVITMCHAVLWSVMLNNFIFAYMAVPSFPDEVEKDPHTYKRWYYILDTVIAAIMFSFYEFSTFQLGSKLDRRLKSIEEKMATKDDLKGFATKDDLKGFATKDDLKATKKDLEATIVAAISPLYEILGAELPAILRTTPDKMDTDSDSDNGDIEIDVVPDVLSNVGEALPFSREAAFDSTIALVNTIRQRKAQKP
jgi:hypothetical protein